MSEKHLVCHNAVCECQHGNMPDKLVIGTHNKHFVNDGEMSKKLIATDKEIGQPFEKNTFGTCRLQPTLFGYKPCQPNITEWTGVYEDIVLESNGGKLLLEDSKATCVIAGSPCVSITDHGQLANVSQQNMDNADEDAMGELNPMVNMKSLDSNNPNIMP
ncbi:MAG: DUF4280 domain-containing protein [Bacteroidales bacterium]